MPSSRCKPALRTDCRQVLGRLNGVRWEGPPAAGCTPRNPVQIGYLCHGRVDAPLLRHARWRDPRVLLLRLRRAGAHRPPARRRAAGRRIAGEHRPPAARPAAGAHRALWRAHPSARNDGDRLSSSALGSRSRAIIGRAAVFTTSCTPTRARLSHGRTPRRPTGRPHRPPVRRTRAGRVDPAGRRHLRRGAGRR